jgi:ABC-type nitrate/sulfonate/bicarbonate transport system substrate-binding protein
MASHAQAARRGARQWTVALLALLTVSVPGLAARASRHHSPEAVLATAASRRAKPPTVVTLALDWTPNTDHTGFYVAKTLGYYRAAGIELKIIPYTTTLPDELVAAGRADFGISFESEVAIDETSGLPVVSVMAILQHQASVVGFRKGSGITRPCDLVGKTFAWDGGTDEIASIEYLIDKDGCKGTLPDGRPNFKVVDLNTTAYAAVYDGRADFDWPLVTWEVIQARLAGEPMSYFDLQHWGFPDHYEVVLISGRRFLARHPGLATRFVQASARGFSFAAHHPVEAARILIADNPGVFGNTALVYDSAKLMARSFWLDAEGRFGVQTYSRWYGYVRFAQEHGILHSATGAVLRSMPKDIGTWFTNAYLDGTARR